MFVCCTCCAQGKRGATAFLEACEQNNVHLVVKLMQIPDVDIAMPTVCVSALPVCTHCCQFRVYAHLTRLFVLTQLKGISPFLAACRAQSLEVVRLLVNDPRIDINKTLVCLALLVCC